MRSAAVRLAGAAAVAVVAGTIVAVQAQGPASESQDPRVGLKPGFRDAGTAAHNMTVVATLPKPDGFFDPEMPAGRPTPPERDREENEEAAGDEATPEGQARPEGGADAPGGAEPGENQSRDEEGPTAEELEERRRRANRLSFSNSDLAFRGNVMFVGNYHGINTYDIAQPDRPRLLASLVCPGGQGDVSIYENLLFMSVEQTRGRLDCGTEGVWDTVSEERFRGVRIFDVSDVRNPRQVAAVQTCRGSHTHTLIVDPDDRENVYIYGSGTSRVRPGEELEGCSDADPEEDPNTALFSIDVIRVPLAAPERAAIVNRPRIFADPETGDIAALWEGGDHGPGTQNSRITSQCHDITVYPEIGLAAGACSGNGILLDISDPVNPVRLDEVVDENFAYWHSATFNNDGTKVVFTDEWGGGSRPRCRASDPITWGANAIFDIVDRKLVFRSYYKMPAPQTEQENCVAHNGSIVPVPGRDIMAQAWYQGGLSVFDFTDSANPVEIAFFDRGPLDAEQLITGGYWSTYWYNGHVYGAEISRGIDVLRLEPSEHLSQDEIAAAGLVQFDIFNSQHQPKVTWPASPVVARAYLDQLARSGAVTADRAATVREALARTEGTSGAAAGRNELETLAGSLERDAAAAAGREAARLRALASTIRGIAATPGN